MSSREAFDATALQNLAIQWVQLSLNYKVAAIRNFSKLEQLISRAKSSEDKSEIAEILGITINN